jgi:UDP-GlcNAc:undecaprenyl-phosphate GlcNAc-1-phosphate transferase
VINAMNMIDGADGLAGGISLIVLLIFFEFSHGGNGANSTFLILLSYAIAGFMLFNMRAPWRPRAAVFLGDSGSMMLGFVLAWYAVDLASVRNVFTPITAVWILAVPLMDTVCLMIRRMLKGGSPFAPDREHLHHVLQRMGFSHGETVMIVWLLALLLASIGVGGWWLGVSEYVMFYGFMALFVLYFVGMVHAWRLMRSIRPSEWKWRRSN